MRCSDLWIIVTKPRNTHAFMICLSTVCVSMCLCVSNEAKEGSGVVLRGSVLVFLPGFKEISYMQDALVKLGHKR